MEFLEKILDWFLGLKFWQQFLIVLFFGGGIIELVITLVGFAGLAIVATVGELPKVFKKYFLDQLFNINFSGRATRKEYWLFFLFYMISYTIFYFFFAFLLTVLKFDYRYYAVLPKLYFVLLLAPHLAISVRRLHDVNIKGYVTAIWLVPLSIGLFNNALIWDWLYIIGFIVYFILAVKKGTIGSNRFGTEQNSNNKVSMEAKKIIVENKHQKTQIKEKEDFKKEEIYIEIEQEEPEEVDPLKDYLIEEKIIEESLDPETYRIINKKLKNLYMILSTEPKDDTDLSMILLSKEEIEKSLDPDFYKIFNKKIKILYEGLADNKDMSDGLFCLPYEKIDESLDSYTNEVINEKIENIYNDFPLYKWKG